MAYQSAYVTDDKPGEDNFNCHQRTPAINDTQVTRNQCTAMQTAEVDEISPGASPALPAARVIARKALDLEPTTPHSDVTQLADGPSTQPSQNEEEDDADLTILSPDKREGPPPYGRSTFESLDVPAMAYDQGTTELSAGPPCLRGTSHQDALRAKINDFLEAPQATDPVFVAMELAAALVLFYKDKAQPPDQQPYTRTRYDLQMIILDVFDFVDRTFSSYENLTPSHKSRRTAMKCVNILNDVDSWYGSKGWATPLPNSQHFSDSGFVETSQSPGLPRTGVAGVDAHDKRSSDGTLSTDPPAKRLRKDDVCEIQTASQSQTPSSRLSSALNQALPSQIQSRGRPHVPHDIPPSSRRQTSQTPDNCETFLQPKTRPALPEQVLAESEEINEEPLLVEAESIEVNENQNSTAPPESLQSQRHSNRENLRCPAPKPYIEGVKRCSSKLKDVRGLMLHIERSHYPSKIFGCPKCHIMCPRNENVYNHLKNVHDINYDDEVSPDKVEEQLVTIDISDTFCDICPLCEEEVPLKTRQNYLNHIKQHFEGQLSSHPYNHRCSSKANHEWRNSSCIPNSYQKRNKKNSKPGKSCYQSDLGSGHDDGDDGDDSSGPPPPGGKSPPGFSGHNGVGVNARQSSHTAFNSINNDGGSASAEMSETSTTTFSFAQLPHGLDSTLRIRSQSSRGTKRYPTTPGVDMVKRCFKSIRSLGRGGFGTVDEVKCKSTNESYARKIIPLNQTSTKVFAELEILKLLRHQHIINLAAHYTTSNQLWLFTTPVAEGNLASYLRADNKRGLSFPDRELFRGWEGDMASALNYLHEHGIIHGDIKPQNVLVSSDLKVYLADFGSARARYLDPSTGREAEPAFALTPKYSAPEVSYRPSINYSWEMGAAADVFSLGATWAEIETVYTGLSIQKFETFRSAGSAYSSFQANLPEIYLWFDFLWLLQESVLQTSRRSTLGSSVLKFARGMLSFDPYQRPSADELSSVLRCTCIVDTLILPNRQKFCANPSSVTSSKGSKLACVDDQILLPTSKIRADFQTEKSNCWNETTESCTSDSGIDTMYTLGTLKPTWIGGSTDSATPRSFGYNTSHYEPQTCIPFAAEIVDVDCISQNVYSRDYSFQEYHAPVLHGACTPFDTRPIQAKDLGYQCLQQKWKIPENLDLDQAFQPESLPLFMVESLDDYLRKTSPPSSAEDTFSLWSSAAGMLRSAVLMDEPSNHKLVAWHADIQPKNILVYRSRIESPYVGQWKIGDFGNNSLQKKKVSKEDDDSFHGSQTANTISTTDAFPPGDSSLEAEGLQMLSMGSVLAHVGAWITRGWEETECTCNCSDRKFGPDFLPQHTKFNIEPDDCELCIRKRPRTAKQDLLVTLSGAIGSLTKSFAESVIAPMLEPPDKQPSWKWLREKAQTLLNDAKAALSGYKKTMAAVGTPVNSSSFKSTCTSSALPTNGSLSDRTEIFLLSIKSGVDGLNVGDDGCHTDFHIEPNISPDGSRYSYSLERYSRDKSDCRYLYPAQGCNAAKELDNIYLGDAIERFERAFGGVRYF